MSTLQSGTTTNSNSDDEDLMKFKERLNRILSQDRHVLNFKAYQPSTVHQERMTELAKIAPELYDNPDITHRSKWFSHPRYRTNAQMPPFHVHFRSELQEVIRYLHKALVVTSENNTKDQHNKQQQQQYIQKYIRRAKDIFRGSMGGLHGHVNIEEYACFPTYQQTFPHVDISFLSQDHKELHRSEDKVIQALRNSLLQQQSNDTGSTSSSTTDDTTSSDNSNIVSALQVVLDFDDHLMAHLGEEEEIVVPMSLTEKRIRF